MVIFEKRWAEVPARLLTSDGNSDGVVLVADSRGFYVNQRVILKSNTRHLKINRILSKTRIEVGELDQEIYKRADISLFLVADSASIEAREQPRPAIGPEETDRATYAEEPAVARRVLGVDELGNAYNETNPLPIAPISLPPGAATEATLIQVRDNLADIEGYVDELESLTQSLVTINTTISSSVDGLEALETSILAAVDGLEPLITSISGFVDQIEGKLDTGNASLASILTSVDGLEGLVTASNALLTTIRDNADNVETLLTAGNASLSSIDGKVATETTLAAVLAATDGLEALITASNSLLTSIRDNTDGIEASLTAIIGHVDGLETLVAAGNASLASIDAKVATEAKQDVGNAALASILTAVDGVETLLTSISNNTDGLEGFVDGIEGLLTTIRDNTDQLEGFVDGIEGLLTTIRDNADAVESLLTSIGNNTDGLEALITTGNASLADIRTATMSIDSKLALNFGAATGAVRTAAQVGNAAGAADFDAGNYSAQTLRAVLATNQPNVPVKYGDTGNLDAFARLRVSEPTSVFDGTFAFDKQPLLWSELVSGGATVTHSAAMSSVDLTVPTTNGAKATFQTKQYIPYHPGKSHVLLVTGNLNGVTANTRKRVGMFDANNGVFFEMSGSTMRVVVRSNTSGSVVDTAVDQSSWNLDRLDGTGASGITLDPTLQQILFIDLQWLGSGRVRFGTVIGGQLVYAHQVLNANVLSVPYMRTASLPVRAELENTATSAGTNTRLTCVAVFSEGGYGIEGVVRTVNNGTTTKAVAGTTRVPILSLRKTSSFANVPVRVLDATVMANSADDLLITIVINGSLTGAAYASARGACERDVSATAITGGTDVTSFYVRGAAGSPSTRTIEDIFKAANILLGSDLAGASDVVSVVAQSLSGAATVLASMTYKELI